MNIRDILGLTLALTACTTELPQSTSTSAVPSADTAVGIHQNAFSLDGALLVQTLGATLNQWVQNHSASFKGHLLIRADGQENITLLREAVIEAKTAGFHTAWLVVSGPTGEEQAIQLALQPPKQQTQVAKAEPTPKVNTHWANLDRLAQPVPIGLRFRLRHPSPPPGLVLP